MSFREFITESKGLYIGVRFAQSFCEDLILFCSKNEIPNRVQRDEIHSTLIYSSKFDNVVINDDGEDIGLGEPLSFHIFETKDNKKALVLLIESEYLSNRHTELMCNYNLTYDFDEYIPHITLSYDIGDFDFSKLNIEELPKVFTINTEYKEDLND